MKNNLQDKNESFADFGSEEHLTELAQSFLAAPLGLRVKRTGVTVLD